MDEAVEGASFTFVPDRIARGKGTREGRACRDRNPGGHVAREGRACRDRERRGCGTREGRAVATGNGADATATSAALPNVPLSRPPPLFQRDCWDRQLRTGESYAQKWEYVRNNPVRKGLVAHADEWPYQGQVNVLEWHERT